MCSMIERTSVRVKGRQSSSASASFPAPKRTGSSAGSPVSASAAAIATPAAPSSRCRVFSAIAATFAGRAGSAIRSWSSTSSAERPQRVAGVALDLGRPGEMAEHERVRRRAVDQAERDTGVRGVQERTLPLDPQQPFPRGRRPRRRAARRRRREVRDDRVDGDPPAGDRDPGLAGRHEHRIEAAALRLAVELERDGHLPDRAVGADGEDDPRVELEVRAGRDVQTVGRLAQVAQLDTVARGELDQLGVVLQVLVQAVLDVEPCRDALLQQLAPGGREAAALGGDADERRRRAEGEAVLDRADDRDALVALARALGVDDRHGRVGAVLHDPAHRLAVVRVAALALGEDQQRLTSARHCQAPAARPGPDPPTASGSRRPARRRATGRA